MLDVVQRFVRAWTYDDMPWREAQDAGLLWAPLRKPHENALDEHWLTRKTFADVEHPELGRSFRYPTSKWLEHQDELAGRPARAAAGRGHRGGAAARRRAGRACRPSRAAWRTRGCRRCTTSRSRCRA